MPLTTKEQEKFEDMFIECTDKRPKKFLRNISDLIFEMTGSVNLKIGLDNAITQAR